jgi:hypothetical protein
MPYLEQYEVDPNNYPNHSINICAIDAAVGVAGTYVTAASLSLPAGKYLISGNVYYLNGAGAAFVNSRLLVGAVAVAPTEGSCIATGAIDLSTALTPVTLIATTTVALQCTSTTATGSIKAAGTNGGAVAGASWISAVRIK